MVFMTQGAVGASLVSSIPFSPKTLLCFISSFLTSRANQLFTFLDKYKIIRFYHLPLILTLCPYIQES